MVMNALKHIEPSYKYEIIQIHTSGEWKASHGEKRLNHQEGGKGLFTKEIESALLKGEIDMAVHSMKDVESFMPNGLTIAACTKREDVRDCLILRNNLQGTINSWEDLPKGAKIGTASVRRHAFMLTKRPDLNIEPLRGNVGTRIRKVREAQVDASFLAMAGLKRLGLDHEADIILPIEDFMPAAAQGAVGIQVKKGREDIIKILSYINHTPTYNAVMAERGVLAALDGSCHTPIGAYARYKEEGSDLLTLDIQVASLDGEQNFTHETKSEINDGETAYDFGFAKGMKLKQSLPPDILEQILHD